MNNAPHDDPFDAEGKSRGPFARVELIYAPDLQLNSAAPRADAETAALEPKPRRAAVRNPMPLAAPARESSLDRHQRKCAVCSHPDRETIEELFFHWHSPLATSLHYRIPVRALFRHAHATGLYAARQGNLRTVLDRVLERAEEATVTSDGIIRAVRAYTCLSPDNQWVEPPSRVIFSSAPVAASLAAAQGIAQIDVDPTPAQLLPSEDSSLQHPASTSHINDSSPQGTAFYPERSRRAAVPIGTAKSGVLTPEVNAPDARMVCETRSAFQNLIDTPAIRK